MASPAMPAAFSFSPRPRWREEREALVEQLKGWGLDAIECYYPKYTLEQQKFYLHLAEKYQLHQTGGSDFHGERVKPDVELAALELVLDWLLS